MTFKEIVVVLLYLAGLALLFALCEGCGILPIQQKPPVPTLPQVNTVIQTVTKTDWIYPICVLLIIGGIAAFILGQGIGIRIAVIGVTGVTVLLTLAKYSTLLPVLGLTFVLGYAILKVYQHRKALVEVVKGTQKIKDYAVKQLQGNRDGLNRLLSEEQTKSTQKIITKIKEKI